MELIFRENFESIPTSNSSVIGTKYIAASDFKENRKQRLVKKVTVPSLSSDYPSYTNPAQQKVHPELSSRKRKLELDHEEIKSVN